MELQNFHTFLERYKIALALIAITIIGFVLRIHNLDFQCMQVDEQYTLGLSQYSPWFITLFSLTVDCNTPLYYLLAHYSTLFFGAVTSYTIRFPSVIIGTLCIPAAYLAGSEFKDDLLGLLVAATVAISYPMIFYSQDARSYALVFLFFALSTYYFIKLYNGDNHWEPKLFFSLFSALALWSHLFSIIPIAFFALAILYKYRIKILPYFALMLVLCLPLLSYVKMALEGTRGNWKGVDSATVLAFMPTEFFGFACIIIVPLFIYSIVASKKKLIWLFTFISIFTVISVTLLNEITATFPHYALEASLLVLLVAYYPVVNFIEKFERQQQIALIVLFIFSIAAFNFIQLKAWYTVYTCLYPQGNVYDFNL